MAEPIPISALLSWAWIAFAMESDNLVEAKATERVGRLFRISLAMWSNALRLIEPAGITVDEVSRRSHATANLAGLERWGWITIGDEGRDRPGFGTARGIGSESVLRPTRAGVFANRVWLEVIDTVEARWRASFDADAINGLDAELGVEDSLPWSPPEIHPSDGFHTQILPEPVPPLGRTPLVAALGQALTRATIVYEQGTTVSLPLAANVLRVVGGDAVPLRALPARAGISKEAVAVATNFLAKRERITVAADKSIRLTPTGTKALAAYQHRANEVDRPGLRSALESLLAQRDVLVAGLRPPPGCWRGQKPYLTETNRVLADPTAALPWHPMVLHRGGWPDGA